MLHSLIYSLAQMVWDLHCKPETSLYHNIFSYLLNRVEIVLLKSRAKWVKNVFVVH